MCVVDATSGILDIHNKKNPPPSGLDGGLLVFLSKLLIQKPPRSPLTFARIDIYCRAYADIYVDPQREILVSVADGDHGFRLNDRDLRV